MPTTDTLSERVPVIVDTDIGGDIDDAICLAYLLRQPRCELVGVTTVSGRDPRERAAMASAVCRAAGRDDVPIHGGAACRMGDGEVMQPDFAVMNRFDHRRADDFAANTAVRFLQETINARPGEITLLAIGPMTNLGLLFALDPETPRKLKRLVLMCGYFGGRPWRSHTNGESDAVDARLDLIDAGLFWNGHPCREWNAICDPLATHIVYRSPVANHLSVGLDVTTLVQMPVTECVTRFNKAGGPLNVVAAMTEGFGRYHKTVMFHDPLAATLIFQPEICKYQQGQVTVELASSRASGLTYFDRDTAERPHHVAWDVNPQAFFDEYFGVTGG